jgi:hypothetical protein
VAARRERRRTVSGKKVQEARVLPFPQHPMHYRTGYF